MKTKARLLAGASGVLAVILALPALAQEAAEQETATSSSSEEVTVTAQRREQRLQDVPIAVTSLSEKSLDEQKIEGGLELLRAVPNVTFTKTNFTSYNFTIRGVGTQSISATSDPAVAVAFNNVPLIQNRLFEQEYFDVSRVEVLRGPQGTLYGRNATAGVVNVISTPADLDGFEGMGRVEVGNFDTRRLVGMVNVPLIEGELAVRLAGAWTQRAGYDYNLITGNNVNGRDLWSGRLSVGWQPDEAVRVNFIWEHFEENDNRSRTGKQLCHRDDGLQMVGSTPTIGHPADFYGNMHAYEFNAVLRPVLFSQGCKPGSLYDDAAFGTPNGLAIPFIFGAVALGNDVSFELGRDENDNSAGLLRLVDPYGGMMQSRDLREIASFRDPRYRAKADLFMLNVDIDISPSLTFSSQTAYVEDSTYSFQDFNRFNTQPIFTDTAQLQYWPGAGKSYADLAPGGVFCDPQLGCSDTMAGFDISQAKATQFNQEFRLQSDFDGPFNFSIGANYTKFDAQVDYYVMFNLLTAVAMMPPFNRPVDDVVDINTCAYSSYTGWVFGTVDPQPASNLNAPCPYIDPNPVENINGEGHNYFRSVNPYKLESTAVFGEAYWNINDTLRLTGGVRYTDDTKIFTTVPSQLLLAPGLVVGGTVARGYPATGAIEQHWDEWTGRVVLDWKPDLSFTDETLLYVSLAHGYKGGGANPPSPGYASEEEILAVIAAADDPALDFIASLVPLPILKTTAVAYSATFDPEFVNAIEIGMKNTLLGGGLRLNVTGFYYDYKDYQVSQVRDRTAVNENFDATSWGFELETVFAPSDRFQLIANVGYLRTRIGDGERSIDIMNRTQGDPNYTLVKPWLQLPSNCVVPTHVAENYLQSSPWITAYWNVCGGLGGLLGWSGLYPPPNDVEFGNAPYDVNNYPELNGGAGLHADLSGNELPNAPRWTVSIGAQYTWDVFTDWSMTLRGDAYWQGQSWARVYNSDPYDRLKSWYNVNLSLLIESPGDMSIELYVKNVFDHTPITGAFLNSDDTGLTTNVFTLDPRIIGLRLTQRW